MTLRCPACGSADFKPCLTNAWDRLFCTTREQFELQECQRCRVILLWPLPAEAELDSYYPSGYWWQTGQTRRGMALWHSLLETYRQLMLAGHVRRVRRLSRDSSLAPARLLDLGCGDGLLLSACRSLPVVRLGVDRSIEALRASRRRGLGVLQGHLSDLPIAGGSVTVVTLIHVLEHLATPEECLREVHRLLAPDGWLVVQVPNTDSLQRRIFGRRWAGFDVPRHLVNYSVTNLTSVLRRHGFRVVRTSHFSARDNPAMMVMSLFPGLYPPARRLGGASSNGIGPWKNAFLDLVYLGLATLALPLAWLESLAARGGTITVEARRA